MGASPISPVQIAKKAEKQMRRNKMVGAGKQYAPTLYTVLVSQADDARLFGYYPTLAGETETYLAAKAAESGLAMDGQPLVRFIADEDLKHGKFEVFGYYPTLAGETETYLAAKAAESGLAMDGQPLVRFIADEDLKHGKFEVIAEMVAAPMIAQLRQEEMERYGIAAPRGAYANRGLQNRRPAPEAARGGYDPYAPQPRDDRYAHDAFYGAGYDAGYDEDVLHQHPHVGIDAAAAASLGDAGAVGAAGAAAGAASGYDDFSAQEHEDVLHQHPHVGIDAAAAASLGDAGAVGAAGAAAGAASGYDDFSAQELKTMVFGQAGAAAMADPAPAQDLQAYLYDVTNDRAFTLTGHPMSIGRESRNDVVVPDINASRSHAEIRMEPSGTWILSDLGSTNGTIINGLNGRKIKSAPLQDADRIIIGTTELEFQLL